MPSPLLCRLNHSWLCTHEALLIGRWSTAAWRSFKANKRLNVVINTLTHSVKDVSHFGIVFLTIFLCASAILMKFDCKFYQVLVGDCYDCDGLCRQSVYCHRYFSSLELLLQNPALAFQICSGYCRCSMFLYWPVGTRTGTRNLQFVYVSIPWFLCHTFVLNAKAMLGLPTLLGIQGVCFKCGTEIGRLVPSCYISLCFHENLSRRSDCYDKRYLLPILCISMQARSHLFIESCSSLFYFDLFCELLSRIWHWHWPKNGPRIEELHLNSSCSTQASLRFGKLRAVDFDIGQPQTPVVCSNVILDWSLVPFTFWHQIELSWNVMNIHELSI